MRVRFLRYIAQAAGANHYTIRRREFLKNTLSAGAALLLSSRVARAVTSKPRVVIIGGGLGGICAADQLREVGADVALLEARKRLGGRVSSDSRSISGMTVELGGEFIGTNHPLWTVLAKRFGLELAEVEDDPPEKNPILIGGHRFSGVDLTKLWEALEGALHRMNVDAREIDAHEPWKSAKADKLDRISLDDVARDWPVDALVRKAALLVLSNDNALRAEQASYLGVLSAISGGGVERFWEESETHRCVGGNQQLAERLALGIGEDRIHRGDPVQRVNLDGGHAIVETKGGKKFEADAVILAIPPSLWDAIEFRPGIPMEYRPNLGPSLKILAELFQPVWEEVGIGPNALTDREVGMTWQGGTCASSKNLSRTCLVGFSGGLAASQFLEIPKEQRRERFNEIVKDLFPAYARHSGKVSIHSWPEDPWTRCGYSTPTLGQVTTIYPKLVKGFADRLFFAGEHTHLAFHGYMEGALQSGVRVARQIAKHLNLVS